MKKLIIGAVSTVFMTGAIAQAASTVQIYIDLEAGKTVNISKGGAAFGNVNAYSFKAYEVGSTDIIPNTGGISPNSDWTRMFCVDIGSSMGTGSSHVYTYSMSLFSDISDLSVFNPDWTASASAIGQKLAGIYNTYVGDIMSSDTTAIKNAKAAGAQVAIWEAIYDFGSFDLNNGWLRLNTSDASYGYANTYLASNPYPSTGWIFLENDTRNPQSLVFPNEASTPRTPDGGTTMLLMGLGMLGLEGLRRKVQK